MANMLSNILFDKIWNCMKSCFEIQAHKKGNCFGRIAKKGIPSYPVSKFQGCQMAWYLCPGLKKE